jgi:hypothetical protein
MSVIEATRIAQEIGRASAPHVRSIMSARTQVATKTSLVPHRFFFINRTPMPPDASSSVN